MTLDLACLAILVLAAVGGAFAGAVPQIAHVGAVVAGWVGARVLGPRVAPLLQGRVPAFAAHPIASLATFIACTVAATLLARALLSLTPLRRVPGSGADRALGALLAGVQAALVLWVGLSALAVWNRPVSMGQAQVDPAGSELVSLAREHNALGAIASARAAMP